MFTYSPNAKKGIVTLEKQRRIIKKTSKSRYVAFTYVWQSVNRRAYQQIPNKDVDIRGETSHFMQQQSDLQRRNL